MTQQDKTTTRPVKMNSHDYDDCIPLHTYRLEQLEKSNAERYDKIIEKLDKNYAKTIELEEKIITHDSRLTALEKRQNTLDGYTKAIIIAIITELLVEALKFLRF